MSTLKVTKIGNGLLDVRMTITEEQFALLQHLAIELYLPAEEPESDYSCEVVDISDGPCGDPSHDIPPVPAPSVIKPLHGICDDCGEGMMQERTNSTTGHTFLGCSEFPECKFTKSGGKNPAPPRSSSTYFEEEEDDGCWDDDFDVPF